MAAKDTTKEKPRIQVFIRSENLQPIGHRIAQLEALVPAQLEPADILNPETWAHIGNKLTPYCLIHVLWMDGSKYIQVMCTHVNGAASRFVPITELKELERLVGSNVNVREDMLIEERGPLKWCVIDTATGDVLHQMCATQAEAIIWRDDMKRARATK